MEKVDVSVLPEWQKKYNWAPIQAWYHENNPKETMKYAESMTNQFIFIRDEVGRIFGDSVKIIEAVSTHTSKSVLLPVYRFVVGDTEVIARCNFHDWKVSVWSKKELEFPLNLLYKEGKENISSCYCEGFKKEWILGSYESNKKEFTVELAPGEHHMWTFLFLLNEQLK